MKLKINDSYFNKGISLELNKKINLIYGSNGSGKTTISRYINRNIKNSFVFNEDYISENVFILDPNRKEIIDLNPEQRKRRATVFVTENVKKIDEWTNNISDMINSYSNNKNEKNVKYISDWHFKNPNWDIFFRNLSEEDVVLLNNKIENELNKSLNDKLKPSQKNIKTISKKYEDNSNLYEGAREIYNSLNKKGLVFIEPNNQKESLKEFEKIIEMNSNQDVIARINDFTSSLTNRFNKVIVELDLKLGQYRDSITEDEKIQRVINNLKKDLINNGMKLNKKEDEKLSSENYLVNKLKKWIDEGKDIHRNVDNFCLYCQNNKIDDDKNISHFLIKITETNRLKIADDIKNTVSKFLAFVIDEEREFNHYFSNETIRKLLIIEGNIKESYGNIKESYESLKELLSFIEENVLDVSMFKKIFIKVDLIKKQFVLKQIDLSSFSVSKNIDTILNCIFVSKADDINTILNVSYMIRILELKKNILKEFQLKLNSQASVEIKNKFDEYKKLGISPLPDDINLILKKSSSGTKGQQNYELCIVDKDGKSPFNIMSTGQRQLIAFILFNLQVEKILENNNNGKINDFLIAIDDPGNGMDYFSFFAISDMIKRMSNFKNNIHNVIFLIMTHDYELINSLYFTFREEQMKLYKLSYDKNIKSLENNGLMKTDMFLITNFISNFLQKIMLEKKSNLSDQIEEDNKKINTTFLFCTSMLVTKIIDNYFKEVIENGLKISLDTKYSMYKNTENILEKNKYNLKNGLKILNFFKKYVALRDGTKVAGKTVKKGIIQLDPNEGQEMKKILFSLICDFKYIYGGDLYLINCLKKICREDFPLSNSMKKIDIVTDNVNRYTSTDLSFEDSQIVKAAKVMYYSKALNGNNLKNKNEILNAISNDLRHSSYSLSNPLITFDYDWLLKNV